MLLLFVNEEKVPVVFATVAPIIIPPGNTTGVKLVKYIMSITHFLLSMASNT